MKQHLYGYRGFTTGRNYVSDFIGPLQPVMPVEGKPVPGNPNWIEIDYSRIEKRLAAYLASKDALPRHDKTNENTSDRAQGT